MEIGSAIALVGVGVAIPAGAVVITALQVYRPKNSNRNGKLSIINAISNNNI